MSESTSQMQSPKTLRARNALVFGVIAFVWVCFDVASKSYLADRYALNDIITEPILGLVRFRLVHNTGAAWGMFDDSTFILGVLALVVCVVMTLYLFVLSPRASLVESIGIALVVAGGLGNAIDRFTLGYVIDFIEPTFISFPVFNIADIGVTCGFVLFLIGLLLRERRDAKRSCDQEDSHIL